MLLAYPCVMSGTQCSQHSFEGEGVWPWGPLAQVTLLVSVPPAYGIGLLVTFMALALMQRGQPALLYLVPCTLITSGALALWRGELGMFWTGSGFAVNTSLL